MKPMTSLAESTLWKHTQSDDLEKVDAAFAELDRRFWAKCSPEAKEYLLAIEERAYERQQRTNRHEDDDRLYSHDPREQE